MAEKKFRHTHTLTELATHFGLGAATCNKWRYVAGFPCGAVIADGPRNLYDVEAITQWLRSRPVPRRARPSKWREHLGLVQYHAKLPPADRARNAVRLKAG